MEELNFIIHEKGYGKENYELKKENEKLKKENQLLKEQIKILKEDVTAIYQEMISLDIIQKVETDDNVELL